jgi:hypothetical protein
MGDLKCRAELAFCSPFSIVSHDLSVYAYMGTYILDDSEG